MFFPCSNIWTNIINKLHKSKKKKRLLSSRQADEHELIPDVLV